MAKEQVFIDTSGFYALLVSNDTYHKSAAALVESLAAKSCHFVSSDYVLDEAITLLRARGIPRQVDMLLEIVDDSAYLSLEWVGPERFLSTRSYLKSHFDHEYSFTDCTSFVIMNELNITAALTADRHFEEAGFRVLLKK